MAIFAAQAVIFVVVLLIAIVLSASSIKSISEENRERKLEAEAFRKRKAAMSGRDTMSKVEKFKHKTMYTLDIIHMPRTIFLIMEIGAFILGFFFGKIILTSSELALIMAIVVAMVPFTFVFVSANWYKQNEAAMLENCMVLITGSYRANKDIIKAVRDNIDKPNMPLAFKTFLSDVTFVDSSVEKALRKVGASVSNRHFDEWIEVLIKSQHDSNMMDILPIIIDEMNEAKKAQKEASAAMKAVWREYALWVVTMICVPLVLKINDDWYNSLVNTPIGKGLVIALFVGLANSLRVMVKISKPTDI